MAAIASPLTVEELARMIGPAELARLHNELLVRDKTYQDFPMGQEVAAFLRAKRKSYAPNTLDAYESTLDKLARRFPYLELKDFEPPVGASPPPTTATSPLSASSSGGTCGAATCWRTRRR
jgi:hypothetical protein